MSNDTQRDLLLEQLASHTPPAPDPLPTDDPFLLISCLQKGLRRADGHTVLGAASALLAVDAPRFWKRLAVIAFEDFGRSDLDLTGAIVVAASSKPWRMAAGGDWTVASFLLGRLLQTPRDRFLDELYTLAIAVVTRPAARADWTKRAVSEELRDLVSTAVHLVATCEAPIPRRQWRAPLAYACDEALREMHRSGRIEEPLLSVCLQGRRTSTCLLPVLLPLMIAAVTSAGGWAKIEHPELPPVRDIDGFPTWVFDGYTRLGRAALVELHDQHRYLAGLWGRSVQMQDRINGLQALLFDVEGGLASEHMTSPLLEELKGCSTGCWSGLTGSARVEGLAMVRDAIPLLNAIRAELWRVSGGGAESTTRNGRNHDE